MESLKKVSIFSAKSFFPKTLFRRAFLIIGIPLVLVQVVFTVVFLDRHLDDVTKGLANNIANTAKIVTDLYESDPFLALAIAHEMGVSARFYKEKPLPPPLSSVEAWEDQFLQSALEQTLRQPYRLTSTSEKLQVNIQTKKGLMIISLPRKRLMSRTTILVFLWAFGSSLFFLIIASIFMRNQVRPLQKLALAAENFGKGLEVVNFKAAGASEVRQVARAFNLMRERIKRQIDQRTGMLAGISHDLRTPLTRMKLSLELLPSSSSVKELKVDVAEMESLIEEYLSFVRGYHLERPSRQNLRTLILGCARNFRHTPLKLKIEAKDSVFIPLRATAFKRALHNLLGNANRYATEATLTLRKHNKTVRIILDDNGKGIPSDKRQEVFKPFYRVESSRNTETGGTGLGLSIAQDIIHSQGGKIELGKSPLGGLRVIIRLPL
jgi:two-component system osmolarity sensor histidine kinase EnvZ